MGAGLLKAHYERILYPLEVFEREEERKNEAMKEEVKEESPDTENGEREYKPHNIPSRMGMKVPTDKEKGGRRTGRMNESCENASPNKQPKEDEKNNSFSKEL